MIDIRQSTNYAKYLKSLKWKVERIEKVNYFVKKLPLIGSLLKVQRPQEIKIDTIRNLAKKYHSFQIIIEPRTNLDAKFLISVGFKPLKKTYLPSKTAQIDLTKSNKEIFNHFKKDAKRAIKRGLGIKIKEYSTPAEIKKFRQEWKKSVNFKRYVPSARQLINLKHAFPQNHSLFIASHNINKEIVGGGVFTRSGKDFSYYWYGFTNKKGRTSLSQYSLVYQGILWAKRLGCKIFDFEGIYDARFPNKSWRGFSHFKRSFGGYEVEYPGCFVKNQLALLNLGFLSRPTH